MYITLCPTLHLFTLPKDMPTALSPLGGPGRPHKKKTPRILGN